MITEDKIKELLNKYLEGKTELNEEQILTEYFKSSNIKDEWKVYQSMFGYFENSKTEKSKKVFKPQTEKSFKSLYKYAAILIVCIAGAWFYNQQYYTQDLGTYDDPELALQETKRVFDLIGSHINSNTSEIQNLTTLETTTTQYIDNIKP